MPDCFSAYSLYSVSIRSSMLSIYCSMMVYLNVMLKMINFDISSNRYLLCPYQFSRQVHLLERAFRSQSFFISLSSFDCWDEISIKKDDSDE